jgi:protein-disulfide isomerase
MILSLCAACTQKSEGLSEKEVKALVEEYLAENPDMLMDIMWDKRDELIGIVEQGAQLRQAFDPEKRREMQLAEPLEPAHDPERVVLGDPAAPILIVEYSNFQCSFCARGSLTVEEIRKQHPDIKVLFKHMPYDELSELSARSFEAATLQDPAKAWQLHDKLFKEQEAVKEQGEQALYDFAAELGLDLERLKRDAFSDVVNTRLDADLRETVRFGIRGTPSYIVGGVTIIGAQPYPVFEDIIQRVKERRKEAGSSQ